MSKTPSKVGTTRSSGCAIAPYLEQHAGVEADHATTFAGHGFPLPGSFAIPCLPECPVEALEILGDGLIEVFGAMRGALDIPNEVDLSQKVDYGFEGPSVNVELFSDDRLEVLSVRDDVLALDGSRDRGGHADELSRLKFPAYEPGVSVDVMKSLMDIMGPQTVDRRTLGQDQIPPNFRKPIWREVYRARRSRERPSGSAPKPRKPRWVRIRCALYRSYVLLGERPIEPITHQIRAQFPR